MENGQNIYKPKENIQLTTNQENVFKHFKLFIQKNDQKVFILNGFAGTGKTTLVKFFVDELRKQKIHYKLMASTGRAAKILTNATGIIATTVHKVIYTLKGFNQDIEEIVKQEDEVGVDKTGQLFLNFTLTPVTQGEKQTIYIIDEASMISDVTDKNPTQALFGNGKLLTDLLNYDTGGKFVFVGDECQLPPVHQEISPALSPAYFKKTFNIDAVELKLTQIVRQQADNSIIRASQQIRKLYENPPQVRWGMLPLGNHKDIKLHGDIISMINRYLEMIANRSYESCTFISPTNSKCNASNKLIRQSLGLAYGLQVGDLLLVTQNNTISQLLNGDLVVVEQIKNVRYQKAKLSFLLVEVRELVTGRRVTQLIIENILFGGLPNLTPAEQKALFVDFYRRMKEKGIRQNDADFKDALYNDIYLNALRCVFGYTLTCHKAQGGEWKEVFVDIPRYLTLNATASAYQWIYTAVTRAREQLHVVNDFFIE